MALLGVKLSFKFADTSRTIESDNSDPTQNFLFKK